MYKWLAGEGKRAINLLIFSYLTQIDGLKG